MASFPSSKGLGWFYGKGHFDQINYVLLAEFLKEETYGTGEQEIRPSPLAGRTCRF